MFLSLFHGWRFSLSITYFHPNLQHFQSILVKLCPLLTVYFVDETGSLEQTRVDWTFLDVAGMRFCHYPLVKTFPLGSESLLGRRDYQWLLFLSFCHNHKGIFLISSLREPGVVPGGKEPVSVWGSFYECDPRNFLLSR